LAQPNTLAAGCNKDSSLSALIFVSEPISSRLNLASDHSFDRVLPHPGNAATPSPGTTMHPSSQPSRTTDILIVDDDAVIREYLRLHLTGAGFSVRMAEDGQAGLEIVTAKPPDLIISDISMPRMDGFDFLEAVRGQPSTEKIPIILLTQYSDLSVFRRGMELGADDFLAKPVKRQDLLNSVNARLKRLEALRRAQLAQNAQKDALKSVRKPLVQPEAVGQGIDLDGYRLLKKLGEGGMSQVFLAEKADDGAQHVLKLARISEHDDGENMQRFLSEHALVSQIDHPSIAKIFSLGFSDTHAYIAMEYFPNGDLRRLLAKPVAPEVAVAAILQVASALAPVHEKGIVHRDLKPDNVMIRANGSLALADFGIAKHLQTLLNETAHGEVFGTPVYIAPEQATGKEVDHRADLYSLGAMFYELLVGKSPYQAKDAQAMLYQHVQAPLPVLPDHLSTFQPLMHRMLAKKPADRPQTANEVINELSRLLAPGTDGDSPIAPVPHNKVFSVDFYGFDIPERVLLAGLVSLSSTQNISFRHFDDALAATALVTTDLLVVDTTDAAANAKAMKVTAAHPIPTIAVGDSTAKNGATRGTLCIARPLKPNEVISAMRETMIRQSKAA
jgi:eukaryotic-like serine/threonine-protein kinase